MKLAVRIVAPLVAVAALAGCSHSPQTAAIVGDQTITEDTVTEVLDSCRKLNPQTGRTSVAVSLAVGDLADIVAERTGMPIDEAAIREQITQDPKVAVVSGTPCEAVVLGSVKLGLVANTDPAAVQQAVENDFTLNPRYGTLDLGQGLDPLGGSISVPADDGNES